MALHKKGGVQLGVTFIDFKQDFDGIIRMKLYISHEEQSKICIIDV